jgi:hypothetical protein
MDILAMWNVNFDGLRTVPLQSAAGADFTTGDSPQLAITQGEKMGHSGNQAESQVGGQEERAELVAVTTETPRGEDERTADPRLRRLAPVRPTLPAAEARKRMDEHLSVLSRPKQQVASAPSRHFGSKGSVAPLEKPKKQSNGFAITSELSIVSHGQFKLAKLGRGTDSDRFLSPM